MGIGLLSTAFFTFRTPLVTRAGGATALFALRFLQGLGEGPTVPALMTLMARWIPPHERSVLGALIFGGSHLGNVFGSFMSGYLLSDGKDWANVFYFFGGFGIVWFILWVGHDWGYYSMVTELPKYSHDVLKFNISKTGTMTALPYIALWVCSFGFGFVGDYCIKKKLHSVKVGRIVHTTIAKTGPAICIILASYSGCNRNAAMIYFILSMALMGGYYSGLKVNTLDLAPNHVGSIVAFANTISTFTGIITPYLTGLLTPDSTVEQWRVAFWVCFAVLVGTNILYIIWAAGEQQWWDDIRHYGFPENWKHGPLLPTVSIDTKQAEIKLLTVTNK